MARYKSKIDPRKMTRSLELCHPQLGVLRRVLSNLYLDPKVYSQTEGRDLKAILTMVSEKHNEVDVRLSQLRRLERANQIEDDESHSRRQP